MRFLLAIFLLLSALPAHAQNLQRALVVPSCGSQTLAAGPLTNLTMNPAGQLCIGGSVGPTYSGPGDAAAAPASAWWGLRAYNGAYAAARGKSVNLRRASDNTQCDFDVAATGALGNSDAGCSLGGGLTLAVFATQDATASCTIATTTATCTGGSSVPHAGSTITGTGVGQPCYASAAGSGTAASFTVALAGGLGVGSAPCGTVGSSTPMTFTYGLYASTAYDQSGAVACTGACDVSQATAAKQPQLLPSCLNGLPCFSFIRVSSQVLQAAAAISTTTISTTSDVSIRIGAQTSIQGDLGNTVGGPYMGFQNAVNTRVAANGASVLATASDNAWHSVHSIQNITIGLSFINVDGVSGSVSAAGGGSSWHNGLLQMGSLASANYLQGYVTEMGLWPINFNSTQLANMCHNQFIYWGTSTSC